jgi:hypothetical protein
LSTNLEIWSRIPGSFSIKFDSRSFSLGINNSWYCTCHQVDPFLSFFFPLSDSLILFLVILTPEKTSWSKIEETVFLVLKVAVFKNFVFALSSKSFQQKFSSEHKVTCQKFSRVFSVFPRTRAFC